MAKRSGGDGIIRSKGRIVGLDGEPGDYGADHFFVLALQSLADGAFQLRLASYALDDEAERLAGACDAQEVGIVLGALDMLATQVESVCTQARKFRKRARYV